jgi:hypothetical protein
LEKNASTPGSKLGHCYSIVFYRHLHHFGEIRGAGNERILSRIIQQMLPVATHTEARHCQCREQNDSA